jgi:hypothetical protein
MGSKTIIKKLTKRERHALIVALVIAPFFYPFLLFWFAQAQLDKISQRAEALPDRLRVIAPLSGGCHMPDELKANARSVWSATGGMVPVLGMDTIGSLDILYNVKFLPVFSRGFEVWKQVSKANDRLYAVWKNPEDECETAGEKLHQAAANLEKALASYGQTRILMWVLLYLWLAAEIFGWIVVIHFARRFLRERAEASSQ